MKEGSEVKRYALLAALTAASLWSYDVSAAVNLPQVCTNSAEVGKRVSEGCGGRAQTGQVYKVPQDSELVRVRNDGGTQGDWNSANYVWAFWRDVSIGQYYDVCLDDVPEGSPVPGECKNWGMIPRGEAAPAFSVTPVTGFAPLEVMVQWDVPAAQNCQAGGSWSGAKAAQGSETITLDAGQHSFTLACSRLIGPPAKGQAVVSWVPATKKVDGTDYDNPKGVVITRNTTETVVTPASVRTYTFTNLDPGEHTFRAQSLDTEGNRSEYTPSVTKIIPNTPTPVAWSAAPVSFTVEAEAPPPVAKPLPPELSVR